MLSVYIGVVVFFFGCLFFSDWLSSGGKWKHALNMAATGAVIVAFVLGCMWALFALAASSI